MSLIQVEVDDQVATITFDHYAKRNALSAELIAEVIVAFDQNRRPL
jgi:enoyl-CoA hydratase/carnithine racemase